MTPNELKSLRSRLALTQSAFGKLIGLSASAVAHLESGKHPITPQTELLLKFITKEDL